MAENGLLDVFGPHYDIFTNFFRGLAESYSPHDTMEEYNQKRDSLKQQIISMIDFEFQAAWNAAHPNANIPSATGGAWRRRSRTTARRHRNHRRTRRN